MTAFPSVFAAACALALAAGCKDKSKCETEGTVVEISGNHGHEASVAKDHVARRVGGTYPLRGGTHEHVFALKDGDVEQLAESKPVTTRATSVNAHTHEVTLRCK